MHPRVRANTHKHTHTLVHTHTHTHTHAHTYTHTQRKTHKGHANTHTIVHTYTHTQKKHTKDMQTRILLYTRTHTYAHRFLTTELLNAASPQEANFRVGGSDCETLVSNTAAYVCLCNLWAEFSVSSMRVSARTWDGCVCVWWGGGGLLVACVCVRARVCVRHAHAGTHADYPCAHAPKCTCTRTRI